MIYELSKIENYPIYVTSNEVIRYCLGLINGMDCKAFQEEQLKKEINEVVIDKVSGFVVSK